jgi:signal transduction histidine kinase
VKGASAVLALAGLAAGVGAALLAANRSVEPYQTAEPVFCLLVGGSFIGSGLVARRQRPRDRLGLVMVSTGFAWFATFLTDARTPLLFTVGTAVQSVYLVGLTYLILAFPSGRLSGRLDRGVLWSALAVTTVLPVAAMLFADSEKSLCGGCPRNVLEIERVDGLANGLLQSERIAGALLAVTAAVLLVRRWLRATAAQRRGAGPVLWAGAATLVTLAGSVAADIVGKPFGQVPKQLLFVAVASLPVAVLIVLLQRQLARGAVAGLVVELGSRAPAGDLRDALARALGDPLLELAYWFADRQHYVDAHGHAVQLPASGGDRVTTMVESGGVPVAALVHDPILQDNVGLVDSVCAAAGMALENKRLQAELLARLGELQQSRGRLVAAAEDERRRIERDLHDGAQQRLVSIAMSLGLLESKVAADPEAATAIARDARQALAGVLHELRELSQGIHPGMLTERGLPAALEELCDRAALPTRLHVTLDGRLPVHVEAAAYFFVSEALTNVAKHAHGREACVAAHHADGVLFIEVADDGIGGAAPEHGSGLRGLADRIEALGGRLRLCSPPGSGTTVRAELPCG